MPEQFGREWLTPRKIIQRQLVQIVSDHPNISPEQASNLRDSLEAGFRSTDYHYEFRILRLTERIKNAIDAGTFGPLHIPNTVDVDGLKIPTPVGQIAELFRDIYTVEFLDQFDDEGEPLPQDPVGG